MIAARFDLAAHVAIDPRRVAFEPCRRAYFNGKKAARVGRLRSSNPYEGRVSPRGAHRVPYSVLGDYWELGYDHERGPAEQARLFA